MRTHCQILVTSFRLGTAVRAEAQLTSMVWNPAGKIHPALDCGASFDPRA